VAGITGAVPAAPPVHRLGLEIRRPVRRPMQRAPAGHECLQHPPSCPARRVALRDRDAKARSAINDCAATSRRAGARRRLRERTRAKERADCADQHTAREVPWPPSAVQLEHSHRHLLVDTSARRPRPAVRVSPASTFEPHSNSRPCPTRPGRVDGRRRRERDCWSRSARPRSRSRRELAPSATNGECAPGVRLLDDVRVFARTRPGKVGRWWPPDVAAERPGLVEL
jgi:hypothetical protein